MGMLAWGTKREVPVKWLPIILSWESVWDRKCLNHKQRTSCLGNCCHIWVQKTNCRMQANPLTTCFSTLKLSWVCNQWDTVSRKLSQVFKNMKSIEKPSVRITSKECWHGAQTAVHQIGAHLEPRKPKPPSWLCFSTRLTCKLYELESYKNIINLHFP